MFSHYQNEFVLNLLHITLLMIHVSCQLSLWECLDYVFLLYLVFFPVNSMINFYFHLQRVQLLLLLHNQQVNQKLMTKKRRKRLNLQNPLLSHPQKQQLHRLGKIKLDFTKFLVPVLLLLVWGGGNEFLI